MFETPCLKYRITNPSDFEAPHKCLNTQEMADSISFITYPYSEEEAKKWVLRADQSFRSSKEWLFSVLLKDIGVYIGSINLHRTNESDAEMGYWLSTDYRGQGFASEMATGAVNFGFNNLGFKKIFATTSLQNIASQKILEKSGFTKTAQINVDTADGPRPSFLFDVYKPA